MENFRSHGGVGKEWHFMAFRKGNDDKMFLNDSKIKNVGFFMMKA